MGALWREFELKIPIFCPRSQFLAGSSHAAAIFSKSAMTDHLLCAYWTAGFTARAPDIRSATCTLLFQVPNRTIRCILNRSARSYGDCMKRDCTAKYWLPMPTDLTENIINKSPTVYVITPLQFLRAFLNASRHSEFTHVFFSWKNKY